MAAKEDYQKKLDTGHCRKEYVHRSSVLGEAIKHSERGNFSVEKLDSAWKDYKRAYNDYHRCLFQDYAVNRIILVGIVRDHSTYITEYATAKVYLEHQESIAEDVFVKVFSTGVFQNPKTDQSDLESRLKTLFESDPEPVKHIRFTLVVIDRSLREASSFKSREEKQALVDLVLMVRVAEDALGQAIKRLAKLNLAKSELSMAITRKKMECFKLVDVKWKLCRDILPKYLSSRTYYKFFKDAMQFTSGEPERNLAELKRLVPKPGMEMVRSHEEFWNVLDSIIDSRDDRDIDQLLEFIEGGDGNEKKEHGEKKKRKKRKRKSGVEQSPGREKSEVSSDQVACPASQVDLVARSAKDQRSPLGEDSQHLHSPRPRRASVFQNLSTEEVVSRRKTMESFPKAAVQDDHRTQIQRKEARLQEKRDYLENVVEVHGKKMADLITTIETIEDHKNGDLKEIRVVEMKISDLQADLERLVRKVKERDDRMIIVAKEKKDLEIDMENKITVAKKEIALLEADLESLKVDAPPDSSKKAEIEQRKTHPNMQLLEYIDNKIKAKEKELECPVCFEVASAPIFMCSDLHLICSDCKPKVTNGPFLNLTNHISGVHLPRMS